MFSMSFGGLLFDQKGWPITGSKLKHDSVKDWQPGYVLCLFLALSLRNQRGYLRDANNIVRKIYLHIVYGDFYYHPFLVPLSIRTSFTRDSAQPNYLFTVYLILPTWSNNLSLVVNPLLTHLEAAGSPRFVRKKVAFVRAVLSVVICAGLGKVAVFLSVILGF